MKKMKGQKSGQKKAAKAAKKIMKKQAAQEKKLARKSANRARKVVKSVKLAVKFSRKLGAQDTRALIDALQKNKKQQFLAGIANLVGVFESVLGRTKIAGSFVRKGPSKAPAKKVEAKAS